MTMLLLVEVEEVVGKKIRPCFTCFGIFTQVPEGSLY